jgi:hypothetical protein
VGAIHTYPYSIQVDAPIVGKRCNIMFFMRVRKSLPFLSDLQLFSIAKKIIAALDDRGKHKTLKYLEIILNRRLEKYGPDGRKKKSG